MFKYLQESYNLQDILEKQEYLENLQSKVAEYVITELHNSLVNLINEVQEDLVELDISKEEMYSRALTYLVERKDDTILDFG